MSTQVAVPIWHKEPHPGYYINSVAVSADGGVIAAGTFFHTYSSSSTSSAAKLAQRQAGSSAPASAPSPSEYGTFGTYVWDGAGNLLMQSEFNGWQGVYWVDVSADGTTVASGGWYSGSPSYQGFIAAYDVSSGATQLFFQMSARGNVVALDGSGSLLLAGADLGYLFARGSDGHFGALPQTISPTASGDTVLVTALSSTGNIGMLGSYQGEVMLVAISAGVAGTPVRWQLPNSAYLHFAALSSDGSMAYVGANDGNLYAISVANFMQSPGAMWSASLPAGATTIYGVACSSNGGVSAAAGNASEGGVVAYFADKYNNGAMYWKDLTAHSPNSVSMDSSGQWVALADGHPDNTPGCFYLWSALGGALQWILPTSDMSWPIKISANASLVVGGSDNGVVYAFAGPSAGPVTSKASSIA